MQTETDHKRQSLQVTLTTRFQQVRAQYTVCCMFFFFFFMGKQDIVIKISSSSLSYDRQIPKHENNDSHQASVKTETDHAGLTPQVTLTTRVLQQVRMYNTLFVAEVPVGTGTCML